MNDVFAAAADREIAECERLLRQAQLGADVVALDRLISDDLLFAGPDGRLATKAQDLEAHRSGVVRFRQHEPRELHIRRVEAGVAIASLEARLAVDVAGEPNEGVFRYTRVWSRDSEGQWRVVGGHVSSVATSVVSARADGP